MHTEINLTHDEIKMVAVVRSPSGSYLLQIGDLMLTLTAKQFLQLAGAVAPPEPQSGSSLV